MSKVLINASAARDGGARSIVEEYVRHHDKDGDHYILLSPFEPKKMPDNFSWKKVETKGFMTVLFALFFVLYYVWCFNASKIVSFSNLNAVFSRVEKVTYFHNFLIINGFGIKFFLIKFVLKTFGRVRQCYVFQTGYVYSEFCKKVFSPSLYLIAWPGVKPIDCNEKKECKKGFSSEDFIRILVPITDLNNKNKNIDLLYSAIRMHGFDDFIFYVTSAEPLDLDECFSNINYIGKLDSEKYSEMILFCDVVLILSYYETICLPIFEALSVNKAALVYQRDYVNFFFKKFGPIYGLTTFSDVDDLKVKLGSLKRDGDIRNNMDPRILLGEWDF